MLIRMFCPQCGAQMDFDENREFMFCQFCGNKVANIKEEKTINLNQNINVSGAIVYKKDTSNEPNLIIDYSTSNPAYALTTIMGNERWIYGNGTTKTYKLEPGKYVIRFCIAKRRWDRIVYIPSDNTPVKVNVIFANRTHISIEQPPQGEAEWQQIEAKMKWEAQQAREEAARKQQEQQAEKVRLKEEKKAAKAEKKAEKKAAKIGVAPIIVEALICPQCKTPYSQGQTFCAKCGKRLN